MSAPSPKPAAKVAAILLAGGRGTRMLGATDDKVMAPLAGKPLIRYSVDAFLQSGVVGSLAIVYRDEEQRCGLEQALPPSPEVTYLWAPGGPNRQDSVWAGLQCLPRDTEIALIHDCARPLVTPQAIALSVEAARASGLACLARRVSDTIKSVEPCGPSWIPATLDRSKLWATETPQTFRFPLIFDAYRELIASGHIATDDLAVVESAAVPVRFIDNGRPNPKLTTAQDIPYLEYLLARA